MKRLSVFAIVTFVGSLVLAGFPASAPAVTLISGSTIKSGAKIRCILAKGVDSRTLETGTDFELIVDDTAHAGLTGAAIHGHVTNVSGPHGLDRARIGFVFDYIAFGNKKRAPIHAMVLSRNVTQINTAAAAKEAAKFSLPVMPVGTVTPGPIAWQITFRGSSVSVTPPPVGQSGGYVYAQNSNENIVIPPGTPVTIELTSNLTIP